MKKLLLMVVCTSCFFAASVYAQDYPSAEQDSVSATLYIPYLEYETDDGEMAAVAAELTAQKDDPELSFVLNINSLVDMEVDAPAEIDGDGACSQSSDAQVKSCKADVENDFFLLQANCVNYASANVRDECFDDAVDERADDLEECDDIEEAHLNLCAVIGEAPYDPILNPDNFLSINEIAANPNPFFPLVPGNTWVYEAEDETITVTVLNETREILDVDAVIVSEIVEEDGEKIEDNVEWYAQDDTGNVWLMGELSRDFEDGEFAAIDGTWEAGEDGAKPGIIFRADPLLGELYRIAFAIGEAEDVGAAQSLSADESTDSGFECEELCLKVLETSPLEPDAAEEQYFLPGVGLIVVEDLEDGEREELLTFIEGN